MRPGLIVGGVLGLGSAIVFGLAAVTAMLFPSGATVATQLNGWAQDGIQMGPGWAKGGPAIQVAPPPFVRNGPVVNAAGGIISLPAPTAGP